MAGLHAGKFAGNLRKFSGRADEESWDGTPSGVGRRVQATKEAANCKSTWMVEEWIEAMPGLDRQSAASWQVLVDALPSGARIPATTPANGHVAVQI